MRIAIEGCCHGELDIIYNSIHKLEEIHKFKIDLLLCCGDFQSVRNERDLRCMAVPPKYLQMQDFHRYYSGEKKAPLLTIFIGGNHEASNYLQELPYGGWVAPNIYYLGYAGVIRIGDLRIGGLSGIYKAPDYLTGHFEKTPYTQSSVRSVYHIRNLEVFRLKQLSGDMDIFMSHDWPRGIYHHGNVKKLLSLKHHFEDDIKNNKLGSRPAEDLLKKLKPTYWFSGHLHVKFSAIMHHEGTENKSECMTKFLALDKCLPRRKFLQVLEVPHSIPEVFEICHDAEWLTILRLTNHLLSTNSRTVYMPGPGCQERYDFSPTPEEIEETISKMGGDLRITADAFEKVVEAFVESKGVPDISFVQMPEPVINPQTTSLCSKLDIDDPLTKTATPSSQLSSVSSSRSGPLNRSELNVTPLSPDAQSSMSSFNVSCNPEEINLSEEDEFELCKDEESGDFILELPQSSPSVKGRWKDISDSFEISPISEKLTVTRSNSYSPLSSSPRIPFGESPRKAFSLSKPKNSPIPLSPLEEVKKEEDIWGGTPSAPSDDGTASESSLASPSATNLSLLGSSQSEEESDPLRGSLSSQKRGSDFDDEGDSSLETLSRSGGKSKKLKRRNVSIYTAVDDDV